MNKRAKSFLAYSALTIAIILGVALFAGAVMAYSAGNSSASINYALMTEDIAGRHYTPTCLGTCDLVFSLSYSGTNAPTSDVIDTNKLRAQFNWAKGQDKFQKSEIYYLDEYQEEAKDYSTVCLPYNTTEGFEGNWTYSYFPNCTQVESGSHLENRQGWKELTKEITLEKGKTYYIDIRGYFKINSQEGFKVDVVPLVKIAASDFMLSEMAWWTGASANIKHKVTLNQTTPSTLYNFTFYLNSSNGYKFSNSDSLVYAMGSIANFPANETSATLYLYRNTSLNEWYLINGSENTRLALDCIAGNNCTSYSPTSVYPPEQFLFLPMYEGTGTTVDDRTSYNNDATFQNLPAWTTDGMVYKAINLFNYSYLSGPLQNLNLSITACAWVKTNGGHTSGNCGGLIGDSVNNGYNSWLMAEDCSGYYSWHWGWTVCGGATPPQSGRARVDRTLVDNGVWHYICGTHNGDTGNTTIWLDGTPRQSKTCGKNITTSGGYWIGQYDNGNYYWNGTIDEVMILNRSLSDDEVMTYFRMLNDSLSILGSAESQGSTTTESDGDKAIMAGIASSVIGGSNIPENYTSQQIYAAYMNGTQKPGRFDVVAVSGNQRWAFNYVTTGDPTSNLTHIGNIEPSLYIWETDTPKSTNDITNEVKNFIDSTKI